MVMGRFFAQGKARIKDAIVECGRPPERQRKLFLFTTRELIRDTGKNAAALQESGNFSGIRNANVM